MDYMQRSGKCPTAAIVFWRYLAVLWGVSYLFFAVFFSVCFMADSACFSLFYLQIVFICCFFREIS